MVFCVKFQKELPGLTQAPLLGPLGQKILSSISQEAWNAWQAKQIMIINEYRLNLAEPASRQRLLKEMEIFLFSP